MVFGLPISVYFRSFRLSLRSYQRETAASYHRSSHHQQDRDQILRICFSNCSNALHSVFPKHSCRSTLHIRYLRQLKEIRFGSSLKPVKHVLQDTLQHPPSHSIAKRDHSRGEPFASLSQSLYESSWYVIFSSHNMNRNLVAQVTKLKGCVESAINSSDSDFIGISFRK